MDFYNRRLVYLIVLIALFVLASIFMMLLYTVSPGLIVDANINLQSFPTISISIKNNSTHIIKNIRVFLNNKDVNDINSLMPKGELFLKYPVNTAKLNLVVSAENHLSFDKTYAVKKYLLSSGVLRFSPSYSFHTSGKESDMNLGICSTQDITVKVDVDLQNLTRGKVSQEISLDANDCKTLQYATVFESKGKKMIRFKIHNDVYSRELLISGYVK